jgi:hypothetical protein
MVPDFLLVRRPFTDSVASTALALGNRRFIVPVLRDKRTKPKRWRRHGEGERRWAIATNDDCDPGFEQVSVLPPCRAASKGTLATSSNNSLLAAWPMMREINDRKGPRVSCAAGSSRFYAVKGGESC